MNIFYFRNQPCNIAAHVGWGEGERAHLCKLRPLPTFEVYCRPGENPGSGLNFHRNFRRLAMFYNES